MNQRVLTPLLALIILAPCALLGCDSTRRDGATGGSYWVPGAREAFTTIEADTLYAVVPDRSHDVYIREVDVSPDRRLTWIVRVPREASMDEPIALVDEPRRGARAWLLEEVTGTPAALAVATGSIVLHARSADTARATVVLEAVTRSRVAGRLSPETLALTHRGSWAREVRTPIALVPKDSRSGADAPSDSAIENPYDDDTDITR